MLDSREKGRLLKTRVEAEVRRNRILLDAAQHAKRAATRDLPHLHQATISHARRTLTAPDEQRLWLDVAELYTREMTRRRTVSRPRTTAHPACNVCGWRHDDDFAEITIPGRRGRQLGSAMNPVRLTGVLPEIVAAVHAAHASGLTGLRTAKLHDRLAGYGEHPSKAFYDLHQTQAYRLLLTVGRPRGLIRLRPANARRIVR